MSITQLSTEILQKIYEYATVQDVLHLAQTSKRNYRAFLGRRMPILETAMYNSYSPLPELVKLVIANEPDKSRKLLSTEIRRNATVNRIIETRELPRMTIELIIKMVQYGKVADRWTEVYPRIRWRQNSNNRRLLRPHEQERLRGAIYRYWTYNSMFHDQVFLQYDPDLPRSRDDPRLRLLRTYSTIQLIQLTEFLDKMQQIIQVDLYPSNAMIRSQYSQPVPPKTLANMGWGEGEQHKRLVLDLMKYSPSDLLHLFENTTTKSQRLDHLLVQGQHFLDAPATLRDSIAIVNFQRQNGVDIDTNIFDEDIEWGVIDPPDDNGGGDWGVHARWAHDASVTGSWDEVEAERMGRLPVGGLDMDTEEEFEEDVDEDA
ncbi:hypothetical protein M430DRAFT_142001 [Amorphotheca resinae ATCC 22711]|uniref:F-box domain-containing protein n=1 Tax=Amorphotheca resinae ATCC 22711 TaxID=857342 RepID=A0A2T3AXM0_AMORE|nr:hypothetical protein M430DRAFT_142001 [Amorphotheca resinae ATCC 22711]PSS14805.1 hypothetical protein M430DRAFT_142001 [Amorphotheca resinae ATCC 22711]